MPEEFESSNSAENNYRLEKGDDCGDRETWVDCKNIFKISITPPSDHQLSADRLFRH